MGQWLRELDSLVSSTHTWCITIPCNPPLTSTNNSSLVTHNTHTHNFIKENNDKI